MVATTPVARAGLLRAFPELAGYGRTATRLHPRPGAPSAAESSVGGPLLWPSDEPWPTCVLPHRVERRGFRPLEEAVRLHASLVAALRTRKDAVIPPAPTGPVPVTWHEFEVLPKPVSLVPVLQLRRGETSAVPFPDGTDLLQILWCPNMHRHFGPAAHVVWRDAARVTDPLPVMPEPDRVEWDGFVPRPCVVHPEDVVEYPPICLVPREDEHYLRFGMMRAELEDGLRLWSDQQPEADDYFALAQAPGWKLGGWDLSTADTEDLRTCACGTRMRPLLDAAHSEWLGSWPPQGDPGFVWGDPQRPRDGEPTGVHFTGSGHFRIFYCPAAPQRHPLTYTVHS